MHTYLREDISDRLRRVNCTEYPVPLDEVQVEHEVPNCCACSRVRLFRLHITI